MMVVSGAIGDPPLWRQRQVVTISSQCSWQVKLLLERERGSILDHVDRRRYISFDIAAIRTSSRSVGPTRPGAPSR
jgi:hypothetical protein